MLLTVAAVPQGLTVRGVALLCAVVDVGDALGKQDVGKGVPSITQANTAWRSRAKGVSYQYHMPHIGMQAHPALYGVLQRSLSLLLFFYVNHTPCIAAPRHTVCPAE